MNGGSYSTYAYVGGNPIGNTDPTGRYCISGLGLTTCSYPGGPTFVIPTPSGFPDYIGPAGLANFFLYHKYDITQALKCSNESEIMQALIDNPTPGNANPATPGGTPNIAVAFGLNNPVTSILTNDIYTGAPVVVNVTGANSPLSPGYVARTVSNGVAHTYGEGLDLQQAVPGSTELAWLLWGYQMQQLIQHSSCGCSQ